MKYKILTISENDLVRTLEAEARLGWEVLELLKTKAPDMYSSYEVYKILMIKKK